VSYYGKRAELTSIGASGERLVAVGSASGGAHGNPRPATWTFDGETLRENIARFELYAGPNAVWLGPIAVGPFGAVMIGAWRGGDGMVGGAAWVSSTGTAFRRIDADPALSSAPNEQVRVLDVAATGEGVVAVGDRRANANRDGQVWVSPSGEAWERAPADGLVGPEDTVLQAVTADGSGRPVLAGTVKDGDVVRLGVWWPDGSGWRGGAVEAGVSGSSATSVATLVADVGGSHLVGGRIDDRPVLLASGSGDAWREVELPAGVPTGDHVELRGCATDEVVVVVATDAAVGETSSVWVAERKELASADS
jgi:hypothetical protein